MYKSNTFILYMQINSIKKHYQINNSVPIDIYQLRFKVNTHLTLGIFYSNNLKISNT